ncbi:Pex7 protein [Saccharomycopsis crataegensis]|uniref:Peroxin-7 n=1 Tax=Saccharomycopsis crataegensis TaxID=43959 RepID=A0AAV5QDC9_9ASCO|nr:Pex7 protein [Saccharomycopsis crataegensis]
MLKFRTSGYSGFSVKYSSFFDNKIAVATSANYGLAGNGRLYILSINPNGQITQDIYFDTQDGLFDLSWSEINENHVAASSGDGTIKLFDLHVGTYPVAVWNEHHKEVFSINWNLTDKSSFVSSSWDGTIKVWSANRKQSLVNLSSSSSTFAPTTKPSSVPLSKSQKPGSNLTNTQCVYQAKVSPHAPNLIASVNASSRLQLWDVRSARPLQMDILCHNGLEALGLDWNKYRSTVLATSGVDKTIRVWDLRMITNKFPASHSLNGSNSAPQNEMVGNQLPVRNVTWSPHSSNKLLSCGYDMTARIWDDVTDKRAPRTINNSTGCINSFNNHKEFVIGGDWSLWGEPGWVVTTGWDEMVYVWNSNRRY